MNRQAVSAQCIAGRMMVELRVLAVKRLPRFRRNNFVLVVVALCLAGINNGEGLVRAKTVVGKTKRQRDIQDMNAAFHESILHKTTFRTREAEKCSPHLRAR